MKPPEQAKKEESGISSLFSLSISFGKKIQKHEHIRSYVEKGAQDLRGPQHYLTIRMELRGGYI